MHRVLVALCYNAWLQPKDPRKETEPTVTLPVISALKTEESSADNTAHAAQPQTLRRGNSGHGGSRRRRNIGDPCNISGTQDR
jgi:hypothetical protein